MLALERMAQDYVRSFELAEGSRYYFDPMEVYKAVFLHGIKCLGAVEDWREPPEVYVKMWEARGCYELLVESDSMRAWQQENHTQATFPTKSGPL